tara:strand:+ start:387 stop:536 length:150 start_codon:yes stop_codon:yes gene_type:complete
MPTVLNKKTGKVEKLPYDKEGMEIANEMEESGDGIIISDARDRNETTYG